MGAAAAADCRILRLLHAGQRCSHPHSTLHLCSKRTVTTIHIQRCRHGESSHAGNSSTTAVSYIPVHLYTYVTVTCIPVYLYTYIPISLCICTPVYLYTSIPVHLYTLYQYARPVHLYTCIPLYLHNCINCIPEICIPVYVYTYTYL